MREVSEFLAECRDKEGDIAEPFELALLGVTEPEAAADIIGPLAEAGATWWQECVWYDRSDEAGWIIRRVECGPL